MSRSLRVDPKYIQKVNLALKRNGYPSQRKFAEDIVPSLSTVKNFLKGKPVDYENFREICERLGLDWQAITYIDVDVDLDGGVAKPHRESTEAVDASVRELNPKTGVDYDPLRNLLAIGKWREADEETRSLILCLVCREIEGSLRARDINKLPSQDLQTIDKLWVKYSGGRFGFSVQKRLWQDVVGSRSNPAYGTLRRFGERVGWYVKGSWLSWSNLSFSVDSAPIGYLPTTSFMIYGNRLLNSAAYLESFFEVEAEHGSGLNVSLFFSRVETCKL